MELVFYFLTRKISTSLVCPTSLLWTQINQRIGPKPTTSRQRVNLHLGYCAIRISLKHYFAGRRGTFPKPVASCFPPTEYVVQCGKGWHNEWPLRFNIGLEFPSQHVKLPIMPRGKTANTYFSCFTVSWGGRGCCARMGETGSLAIAEVYRRRKVAGSVGRRLG